LLPPPGERGDRLPFTESKQAMLPLRPRGPDASPPPGFCSGWQPATELQLATPSSWPSPRSSNARGNRKSARLPTGVATSSRGFSGRCRADPQGQAVASAGLVELHGAQCCSQGPQAAKCVAEGLLKLFAAEPWSAQRLAGLRRPEVMAPFEPQPHGAGSRELARHQQKSAMGMGRKGGPLGCLNLRPSSAGSRAFEGPEISGSASLRLRAEGSGWTGQGPRPAPLKTASRSRFGAGSRSRNSVYQALQAIGCGAARQWTCWRTPSSQPSRRPTPASTQSLTDVLQFQRPAPCRRWRQDPSRRHHIGRNQG